jgi:hypothetical protein
MARFPLSPWALLLAAGATGLMSRAALGAPSDAAALKLRSESIDADYLATNFEAAAEKLQKALALCVAPVDCSAAVRARILCDLGVVDFMLGRGAEGRARFAAALEADPGVALDKDLSSEDLERELARARGRAWSNSRPPSAAPVEREDCPPDFPGCDARPTPPCGSDEECAEGQTCRGGACAASPPPEARPLRLRNWLSVAFQTDALFLPSASNACSGGTGYTCFGGNGSYYADVPLAGADDQVNGGVAIATSRVLLGYDRALGENLTLGARIGYAMGGGPPRPAASVFLPIHVEARMTYWFGENPLARSGFRFFVLAAGGMAEVDASVPVDVYASAQAYESQQLQDYRAWKKTGLAFAALGCGGMYALTRATGIAVEAKAMELFPTPASGFNLQLAYVVGL